MTFRNGESSPSPGGEDDASELLPEKAVFSYSPVSISSLPVSVPVSAVKTSLPEEPKEDEMQAESMEGVGCRSEV